MAKAKATATKEVKAVKTTKTAAKPAAAKTKSATATAAPKKTTTATKTTKASAKKVETVALTPDLIAQRAYEIYLSRNGFGGDHFSDWVQAEAELKSRLN